MGIKSIVPVASIVVLSTSVNAALVTNINGPDIGGTLYDVTLHSGTGDTFNALWALASSLAQILALPV